MRGLDTCPAYIGGLVTLRVGDLKKSFLKSVVMLSHPRTSVDKTGQNVNCLKVARPQSDQECRLLCRSVQNSDCHLV